MAATCMTAWMKVSARDIDHLTLTVADPNSVATRLQQVGFTLTPEGTDPRCICFPPAADDIPNYIEVTEGSHSGMTLAVNVEKLKGEERTFSWESEDGLVVSAEVIVGDGDGPLPWLPVKQVQPEAFMEPEWIIHPNGALGMIAIHAVSDDPKDTARKLAALWKGESEDIFDGCAVVKTGAMELLIWSPAAYQAEYKAIEVMAPKQLPSVVGIAIAVERPRPLQALLRANNVTFALTEGDRILVPPDQTGGLVIEFMPQT
jgi:hypothetical protein